MYELILLPFEIDGLKINDEYEYINSSCIPRKSEIIEKFKITVENDDEEINDYLLQIEVQSVHYKLYEDKSVMPIVYGTVIGIDKEV